jgi:hypothetical protein
MTPEPEQLLSRRQIRIEAFRRAVLDQPGGTEVERADVEAAMLQTDRERSSARKPDSRKSS